MGVINHRIDREQRGNVSHHRTRLANDNTSSGQAQGSRRSRRPLDLSRAHIPLRAYFGRRLIGPNYEWSACDPSALRREMPRHYTSPLVLNSLPPRRRVSGDRD
jgi:hypothetical protein